MRVGFVGLGAMGMHMARNLHKAGLLAGVFNRSADKARQLADELKVTAYPTLAALAAAVDAVVVFAEETPLELIRALRPQVLVKGADYREDQVVGAAEVRSWGGRVVLVPLLDGRSTSAAISRLRG